jgi:hypothetical protein
LAASELGLSGRPRRRCSAAPASSTQVRLTFSRYIDPRSVMASGAQFTFDHGLVATAASVAGRTVTLTTSSQMAATAYTVTVASSVTDRAADRRADSASPGSATGGGGLSVHTTLGIPSPSPTASSYPSLGQGRLRASYNSSRKVPNWVSWELNTSHFGSTSRQDDYRPDAAADLPQAQLANGMGRGYDRGHMCPSADRTLTVAANSQTFYLTNMVPQAANNNQARGTTSRTSPATWRAPARSCSSSRAACSARARTRSAAAWSCPTRRSR